MRLTPSIAALFLALCAAAGAAAARDEPLRAAPAAGSAPAPDYEFHDAHFHLTNYVQQGPGIEEFLAVIDERVGRVALFGIPLQQKWDHDLSGYRAPAYYLHSDAPLYYYSFVDAAIAQAYLSLPPEQRARFDPMITGFNPGDMYAVDHIRRVLRTFPGVFSGIGEFSVHKEFVSPKIAGHDASLTDPALDRILELAAEVGLVVILHNDIDIVYPPQGNEPAYLAQLKELLARHPGATVIWAHTGLGRVVRPPEGHLELLDELLSDPAFSHVHLDISWDEVARQVTADVDTTLAWAALMKRHPTRFLFGTDAVATAGPAEYFKTYHDYAPLWNLLDRRTSELVRMGNYERLFDLAARRVRAWEKAHAGEAGAPLGEVHRRR